MNGLAEIEINGENVQLKFGLPAIQSIYENIDKIKLLESDIYNLVAFAHIIYGGYLNHCIIKQEIPGLSFEQILEWVEENANNTKILEVVHAFENSKFIKKAMVITEKKRSIGKKSGKPVSVSLD